MNINFELYKIFYVVGMTKNITKAGEYLMITQPAVTQGIKNLEASLNTTLFIRTKKGVILTSEGEELFKYIKEGMNYFINGTNKLNELKKLDNGVIRIGASTSLTENYLMKYITKFHRLHPNIEIKIANNLSENLLKDLRNGNIDIVIGSKFKENKDLKFNHLFDTDYIFISNRCINNCDILKESLILQTKPSVLRNTFNDYLKENGLSANIAMEVVSHKLVVDMTKAGLGIGLVVKEYVKDELNNKELYEIDTNLNIGKRSIGYILKDNFIPSYAVKEFIRIISK